ncbi:hypothetical protein CP533_6752 [Ophiocordyceps camponoti-saundersi (nom. inval.)]|nr:hypothetical protein CP533_6752 [Ophiocordyceps camponoti-saundersi (nom. inval.)]
MKVSLAIITTSLIGTAIASTSCHGNQCKGKSFRACVAACSSQQQQQQRESAAEPSYSASSSSSATADRYNNPCGGNWATEPASNHPLPDPLPHGCKYHRSEEARKTASS